MDNKIIIIGAGISGATLAERYANKGSKVIIIEKRDHIGGNCYDFINSDGLLVPLYGPHLFHTNYEDVWEYVNKFSEWTPYEHRVLSFVDGMYVPVPVNITTVNTLFKLNLDEEGMIKWLDENTEKIENPKNSEAAALARVGKVLYQKMFKNYTKKQWDLYPKELDAQVMNRIPVRTNFDDRYFTDKYQALPKDGYTKLFKKLLNHKNIEVRLNTDYFDIKDSLGKYDKLFYTGKIDTFFNYKFSNIEKLQYRSLNFEFETLDQEYYQPVTTVNYPNDYKFTRITEHKRATGQIHPKTTIIREYSTWEGEPYYPVPNPKNQNLYEEYKKETEKLKDIYFVGRLANYKYFNMDQAFKNALDLFDIIESNEK
jgi:UDP-galactopyranose mutase